MGTIVQTFNTAGAWSTTAPAGTVSVVMVLNGGGGSTPIAKSSSFGAGGGAQLTFSTTISPGATLSGNIGSPDAGDTTCTQYTLDAGTGTDGTITAAGTGGVWSGSGATGSNGGNGGGVNGYYGGGSPGGGVQQTTPNANGNPPGGGASGANGSGGAATIGATGQVVLTFTTETTYTQSVGVQDTQSVKEIKSPTKRISASNIEIALAIKAISRTIKLVQVGVAAVGKGFFRKTSITETQSLSALTSILRDFFVSTIEVVSNKNSTSKTIQLLSSETVGVLRIIGKLIGVVGVQVVSILRSISRTVMLFEANVASTFKTSEKLISLASAEAIKAGVVKFANKVVGVISFEVSNSTRTISRNFSLFEAQSLSLVRNSIKIVRAASNETVSLLTSISRSISTVIQESIGNSFSRVLDRIIISINNSAAAAIDIINLIRSVSNTQVIGYQRALAKITSIKSNSIILSVKAIARTLTSITSNQSVGAFKAIQRTIVVIQAQSINLTRHLPFHNSIRTTSVAGEFNQKVKLVSIHVFEVQVIGFLKLFLKVSGITTSQTINLGKAISRTISGLSSGVVSNTSGVARAIGTAIAQTVNFISSRGHYVFAQQAQIINILTNFYHRRRMAVWIRKQRNLN